jgi:hypothetical protein
VLEKRLISLLPVQWEKETACSHCGVEHLVAKRIGQMSVLVTPDDATGEYIRGRQHLHLT